MNFNVSLNLDGKPLSWISKKDGRVHLVFDGGPGSETVFNFSAEAFGQLTAALDRFNGGSGVKADPDKGKITLQYANVDLEHERVAIKGDADSVDLEKQLPTIIISDMKGEELLSLTFNKKQAIDIERRLRNALEAQDCFKSSLERKVIEAQ